MLSLTERRRRETRNEIATAACALFLADGYDATTVEAVATAAGVSRRTAYRHFPNKEDLVFVHGLVWLEAYDELLETRTHDETTHAFLNRVVVGVAEVIEGSSDQVLPMFAMANENEFLRSRLGRFQDQWIERYVAAMLADVGDDPVAFAQAAVMAGTLVGITTAALGLWVLGQPDADLPTITAMALQQVDSVWPDPCR